MPVWVDGQTVRGYKSEQFREAFYRALGVTSVRGVSSGLGSEAAPNTPNAPNAYSAEGTTDGHVPTFGDADYLDFVTGVFQAGHITTAEALALKRIHDVTVVEA